MTSTRATAAGLGAIAIWGGTIAWMRTISDALGPMSGGAWMCIVSALVLWALRLGQGQLRLPRVSLRSIGVNGTLFATYLVCFTAAIGLATTRVDAVAVGMVNYLWPSLAVLFAPIAARQPVRATLLAAVAIALFGTGFAVLGGGAATLSQALAGVLSRPAPYALAACAALCWAIYSNVAEYGRRPGDENPVVVYATLAAVATALTTQLSEGLAIPRSMTVIASVGALGAATALSYLGWDLAMRSGDRRVVGTAALFTPVLSVSAASLAFGSVPGAHVWIGAGLLVLAAFVANLGRG
jgi:drug/metabolite transporter (DMT)-like permease